MESSWRLNVWTYGLCNMYEFPQATLASRILGGSGAVPIATNSVNGFGQMVAVNLPGEVFEDFYLFTGYFRIGSRFPYQFDVEPDVHT